MGLSSCAPPALPLRARPPEGDIRRPTKSWGQSLFTACNCGLSRKGVQSFLGRPGVFCAPSPGFAKPPEGVQENLGRPGVFL